MPFPTTPVLDNFNRTDGPLGANWTNPINADGQAQIISNAFSNASSGVVCSAAWTASFGADQEVYATITQQASLRMNLWARLNTGTPPVTSYILRYTNSSTLLDIRSIINGAASTSLGTVVQSVAVGDSFGLSVIGTILTAYYKAAAGSWTSVLTVADSGINSGAFIAMSVGDAVVATGSLDNFGGGSVIGNPAPLLQPVTMGASW